MEVEIVTKVELEEFRERLLSDLKILLSKDEKVPNKKWLRSNEVRGLLKISPGTLQNHCLNGVLHPTKIGGINYYKSEEIEEILNGNL